MNFSPLAPAAFAVHRRRLSLPAKLVGSTFVATAIAFLLALAYPDLQHWFVVPVVACGAILGLDFYGWLNGEMNLFDPRGILAAMGVHFFFFAPMLQVITNTELMWVADQPADYRPWLGLMGCVNLVGLLCYRVSCSYFARGSRSLRTTWTFKATTFLPTIVAVTLVSLSAELYVLVKFGGIAGLILTFSEDQEKFADTGWLFMLSESLPILIMITVAAVCRRKRVSWFVLGPLLVLFVLLEFVVGGWRGSRQNVIWATIWGLGIIHYGLRPISRKTLLLLALVGIGFMYFYGFYKYAGLQGLRALTDSEWRRVAVEKSGRSFGSVMVQDLGRSDVQALALYRLATTPGEHHYAWGRTYLGALNLLIPRAILSDRLPTKVKWTTDLEYGEGSYESGHYPSSRVYGLAGEAMLNFGVLGVPLAFALFGYLMARMSTLSNSVDRGDARILLMPFLAVLAVVILAHDLDVDLFVIAKNCFLPAAAIYFGSRRKATLREGHRSCP